MWKRKIKEELKANELLKLHTTAFHKSTSSRHRVPYGFNRNDPKESNLFCVHGRFYGRGVSILGTQQNNVRKTF